MDARVKILLLIGFLLLIFFVENPAGFAVLSVAVGVLMVMSRVPLMMQLRSVRPILWIVVFTFFVHLFMTPGEEAFRLGVLTATWEGLARGGYIGLRLILLILLSTLLTLTTSPLRLTDGLEALMSPLRRVGVPVHELSMMMTIALRFVPTLLEEMDARCYQGGEGRTRMKEMRIGRLDYAAVAIFLTGAAGVCAVSLGGSYLAP